MKRDMELIRKLVLLLEEDPSGRAPQGIRVEGYSDDQIGYHAYLMVNSGIAEGYDAASMDSPGPYYVLENLTSAGHDFADSARTQYIWDEVMGDIRKKGVVSVTVEVLKGMLDRKIKKHLDGD